MGINLINFLPCQIKVLLNFAASPLFLIHSLVLFTCLRLAFETFSYQFLAKFYVTRALYHFNIYNITLCLLLLNSPLT